STSRSRSTAASAGTRSGASRSRSTRSPSRRRARPSPARTCSSCCAASTSWARSSGRSCCSTSTGTITRRPPRCSGSPYPTWARSSDASRTSCASRSNSARAPTDRRTLVQLDDLKQAWAAHGATLERSLAIDERLLREMFLRKVRFALVPYLAWMALELALGIAALFVVMPVLSAHLGEPRYLVAGGALAVYAVAITWHCAYLLVSGLQLDYGGPVTAIQRDVERIRLVEYRALKWALLGGVVVWLPA